MQVFGLESINNLKQVSKKDEANITEKTNRRMRRNGMIQIAQVIENSSSYTEDMGTTATKRRFQKSHLDGNAAIKDMRGTLLRKCARQLSYVCTRHA